LYRRLSHWYVATYAKTPLWFNDLPKTLVEKGRPRPQARPMRGETQLTAAREHALLRLRVCVTCSARLSPQRESWLCSKPCPGGSHHEVAQTLRCRSDWISAPQSSASSRSDCPSRISHTLNRDCKVRLGGYVAKASRLLASWFEAHHGPNSDQNVTHGDLKLH